MKQTDVLKHWANTWRSLAAWGAPISMKIAIKTSHNCVMRRGTAWPGQQRANVYADGDLVANLTTTLHEMAHLAAPYGAHHSEAWRVMFARAASEALGARFEDFDLDVELEVLNLQVRDAVKNWLDRSGQAIVLKAIGVL